MEHTKGKWKYKKTHQASGDTWYVIIDENGYGPITDVGGKDENGQIAEMKHLITNPKEIEANARLIAAAPDLLETCERLQERLEHLILRTPTGKLREKLTNDNVLALQTISKARGE